MVSVDVVAADLSNSIAEASDLDEALGVLAHELLEGSSEERVDGPWDGVADDPTS